MNRRTDIAAWVPLHTSRQDLKVLCSQRAWTKSSRENRLQEVRGDEVPGYGKSGDRQVTTALFVVGMPRSGTTWTMLLLAQHPAVVALQQSGFFHALKPLQDWWHTTGEYGKSVVAESDGEDGKPVRKALSDVLAPQEFYELARRVAGRVFDSVATTKPGARVVVEQTPENLGLADFILRVFPDAHFLHVIRDPRAVFASSRSAAATWSTANSFPTSAIDAAKEWRATLESAQRLHSATSRYREVRYEALLQDGPQELEKLFTWLGLACDRTLCERAVERCEIDKLRGSTLAPPAFFRRGRPETWREELSGSDIRSLEYLVGESMEGLGYSRMFPGTGRKPLALWLLEIVASVLRSPFASWIRRSTAGLRRRLRTLSS